MVSWWFTFDSHPCLTKRLAQPQFVLEPFCVEGLSPVKTSRANKPRMRRGGILFERRSTEVQSPKWKTHTHIRGLLQPLKPRPTPGQACTGRATHQRSHALPHGADAAGFFCPFDRFAWQLTAGMHRGPVVPTLAVSFLGEGSPTKIDCRKSWYPYSNLSTGGPRH